jgi:hypothetical protein
MWSRDIAQFGLRRTWQANFQLPREEAALRVRRYSVEHERFERLEGAMLRGHGRRPWLAGSGGWAFPLLGGAK